MPLPRRRLDRSDEMGSFDGWEIPIVPLKPSLNRREPDLPASGVVGPVFPRFGGGGGEGGGLYVLNGFGSFEYRRRPWEAAECNGDLNRDLEAQLRMLRS